MMTTFRDSIATEALAALITNPRSPLINGRQYQYGDPLPTPQDLARLAYELADALVAAAADPHVAQGAAPTAEAQS